MAEPTRLMSLIEAGIRLGGVDKKTVKRRLDEAGIVPARPGRAMMITETDLTRLIEACRCRCAPFPPAPGRPEEASTNYSSSKAGLPGGNTRSRQNSPPAPRRGQFAWALAEAEREILARAEAGRVPGAGEKMSFRQAAGLYGAYRDLDLAGKHPDAYQSPELATVRAALATIRRLGKPAIGKK